MNINTFTPQENLNFSRLMLLEKKRLVESDNVPGVDKEQIIRQIEDNIEIINNEIKKITN